jgi:hypothetical protein
MLASIPTRYGIQTSGITFQRNGRAFTGIGINHFSLLLRQLVSNLGPAVDADSDLRAIKQTWGLPFVRFSAGFYDRTTWLTNWYQNKAAYFAAFDTVVASAERYGVGLIPCLLWGARPFSDICYNTAAATLQWPAKLADTSSPAWALFAEFVNDVVARYRNSPAIWAWDLGNEIVSNCGPEYNAAWLLDGTGTDAGATPLPASLSWGTRPDGTNYPANNKMSLPNWIAFSYAATRLIQQTDGHGRLVISGAALGNSFAVNAQANNSLQADTLTQWSSGVAATLNMPWLVYREQAFPATNMHIYPQSLSNSRVFSGAEKTQAELIALCRGWSDAAGKPFLLTEWGATYWGDPVDEASTSLAAETANFSAALAAVQANCLVSAIWNYGGDLAGGSNWMKWRLSDAARTYQLTAVAAANAAMSN